MDLYFFINEVFFVLLEGFLYFYLFLYLVNKLDILRHSPTSVLYGVVSFTVFSYWINTYQLLPHTLFFLLFNLCVFTYLTKTNIYKAVVANAAVFMLYGFTEVIFTIILLLLMGVPVTQVAEEPQLKMTVLLIVRPVQILFFIGVSRYKLRDFLSKYGIFSRDNHPLVYVLLLLLTTGIFYGSSLRVMEDTTYFLITGFLFVSIIILGMVNVKEMLEAKTIQNQLLIQKEYAQSMELVVDIARKEKHDYNNHLNTLVAICMSGEPDLSERVRFYAKKLIENSNSGSTFRFYNTGNKYLDGLLAVKTNQAGEQGIYFEVDTEASLNGLSLDDVDLTTMVGNIINNAFDAVSLNPPDKKGIVSLLIYKENDRVYISITNNGPKIPDVHTQHIFSYKYSTKAKTNGERGFGLYIVKELVSRNHGNIRFHSSAQETEFILEFGAGELSEPLA